MNGLMKMSLLELGFPMGNGKANSPEDISSMVTLLKSSTARFRRRSM